MPDSKRFLLRLDPGLFVAIRRWADDDLRSVNAQIEFLLSDVARRTGRLSHRRGKRSSSDTDAGAPPGDGQPDEPQALLVMAGGM